MNLDFHLLTLFDYYYYVLMSICGPTCSKCMDQPGMVGCQPCLWSAEHSKIMFPCPRSRLRNGSGETGSAVPSRVSLLISIPWLNLVLIYGIPPEFGRHVPRQPPHSSHSNWIGYLLMEFSRFPRQSPFITVIYHVPGTVYCYDIMKVTVKVVPAPVISSQASPVTPIV